MHPINKVQLTGNLGADPEVKIIENGNKRVTFSLAINETFKTRDGETNSRTEWHSIVAWGKVAEQAEAELRKGSFVALEGRLSSRVVKKDDGESRYYVDVVANEINVIKKQEA